MFLQTSELERESLRILFTKCDDFSFTHTASKLAMLFEAHLRGYLAGGGRTYPLGCTDNFNTGVLSLVRGFKTRKHTLRGKPILPFAT